MDYKDIMKILSGGNANPDMTTMLSALSSGGADMNSLLPLLMKNMQKGEAGKVTSQSDGSTPFLPSEDEINAALIKLNEQTRRDM